MHFTPNAQALRGFQSRESQEEISPTRAADNFSSHLVDENWDWVLEPHGVRGEMYYIPQVSLLPESHHPTRWIGDRSVAYIEEQSDTEQPWYLYSSFIHPHPPFAPPVPWHKFYRGPDMPLPDIPEDSEDLIFFINRYQNRYKYRDRGGLDLNLVRQMRAYYYACVDFIDAQVGRILDALERTGQLENSLILFSADHGEYLGDYSCFGKRGMHEASARIPLIVRWPDGFMAGRKPEGPASLVDLAPTFMDIAGQKVAPGEFDGESLRAIADGTRERDCVYSQYNQGPNGLYMAVEKEWKYIFSAPDQKEVLFNLSSDPHEHHNLSTSPEHSDTLVRMRQRCLVWVAKDNQEQAIDNTGNWRVYPIRKMPENPDENLIFQDPHWWHGRENADLLS